MLAAFYRKFNLKNGLTIAASFTIAGFAVMALAKSYPALVIGCSLTGFGNQLGGIVPGVLADHFVGAYLPTVYIFLAETVITLAVVLLTYRASDRTRG